MPPKTLAKLIGNICLIGVLVATNWATVTGQEPELLQKLAPTEAAVETQDVSETETISAAATTVLYPSDDAPVREGAPTSTAPNNPYLGAGYDDGYLYGTTGRVRSYLRFDLSSLSSANTISSATLRLYHAGGGDYYADRARTVTLYRVSNNWDDQSITWSNRPGYAEAVGSIATVYDYDGWVSVDLTSLVQDWVSGSYSNYGLVAIGPESSAGIYRVFFSSEDGRRPELEINYVPPQPPVLDVWPGTRTVKASNTQTQFTSSIQVSDVTYGSLDWTAIKVGSASWLSLSNPSGTVTPTTPDDLVLTINPFGLAPGTYTEQVRVSSNTPDVIGSPMTATVSLEVLDFLSNVYLPLILKSGGETGSPDVVALVVGIADYHYLDPAPTVGELPDDWGFDLSEPGHDANDMVALLQEEFGVNAGNITHLGDCNCGSSSSGLTALACDGIATRENFIAALHQLDQQENENTTVVIYYSGHGGQVPDLNGDEGDGYDEFIAMYDTNLVNNQYERVVTDDELATLLGNLESSCVTVIIDSCYSGGLITAAESPSGSGDMQRRGLANPYGGEQISAQYALADLAEPGRLVITGGTEDQPTWESATLQNGVFTYHFVEGMRDATNDVNQNSCISFEEAYWFTRDSVDDWIYSRQMVHQNPNISDQCYGQVEVK